MIYCFNEDNSIQSSTSTYNPLQGSGAAKISRLSDSTASFFVNRMSIVRPASFFENSLVFDAAQHISNLEFMQEFPELDHTEQAAITEQLFLTIDELRFMTGDDVEQVLLDLNNAYVPASYGQSEETVSVNHTSTVDTTLIEELYKWVSFKYVVSDNEYEFKVYSVEEDFKTEYPYTTFGKVLYSIPVSAMVSLANDSTLSIPMLNTASSVESINLAAMDKDNTGVFLVESSFNNTMFNISIGVCYQGAPPKLQEARAYVAEDLVTAQYTSDYWKVLLPELFATNQFFYIPLWNTYYLSGTTKIFPCMLSLKQGVSHLEAVFTDVPAGFIDSYGKCMQAPGPDTYIVALPSEFNAIDSLDLNTFYPDYIRDNSAIGLYAHVTNETRVYMTKMSAAMAQAKIAPSSSCQLIHGLLWYPFVHNDATHYILLEAEYSNISV